jgi:radical SAM superfamily enzyme YgiQ (UPF0313 family)
LIDVCLVNPRTEYRDETTKKREQHYKNEFLRYSDSYSREPPSGLMILASILDKNGYSVEFLDCSVLENPHHYIRQNAHKYRLFGFTALTNTFSETAELAKIVKRKNPGAFIIFGGPHVSFTYEAVLRTYPFIDVVCVGESEISFPWLVDFLLIEPATEFMYNKKTVDFTRHQNRPGYIQKKIHEFLSAKGNKSTILTKGLAIPDKYILDPFLSQLPNYQSFPDYCTNKQYDIHFDANKSDTLQINFSGFPDAVDLRSVPLPARHLIPMTYSVADVVVNRGCPNKCSFCSRTQLFPEIRIRSIESLKEELEQILSYSNYRFVNFYDNINFNKSFFTQFLSMLLSMKFPLPWGAELRVDAITPEFASMLKESNCKIIATGIESADETVLKTNCKIQSPIKVLEGISLLKQAGIAVQAYFVVGLPGETEESFQKTLKYAEKLPLKSGFDKMEFFVATPYPGSDLALNPDKYAIKIIKKNYNLYNCRRILMETSTLKRSQVLTMIKKAKDLKKRLKFH